METETITTEQIARDLGWTHRKVMHAIDDAVAAGYLTVAEDGHLEPTLPAEAGEVA